MELHRAVSEVKGKSEDERVDERVNTKSDQNQAPRGALTFDPAVDD